MHSHLDNTHGLEGLVQVAKCQLVAELEHSLARVCPAKGARDQRTRMRGLPKRDDGCRWRVMGGQRWEEKGAGPGRGQEGVCDRACEVSTAIRLRRFAQTPQTSVGIFQACKITKRLLCNHSRRLALHPGGEIEHGHLVQEDAQCQEHHTGPPPPPLPFPPPMFSPRAVLQGESSGGTPSRREGFPSRARAQRSGGRLVRRSG
jgi:hypothetical protein